MVALFSLLPLRISSFFTEDRAGIHILDPPAVPEIAVPLASAFLTLSASQLGGKALSRGLFLPVFELGAFVRQIAAMLQGIKVLELKVRENKVTDQELMACVQVLQQAALCFNE